MKSTVPSRSLFVIALLITLAVTACQSDTDTDTIEPIPILVATSIIPIQNPTPTTEPPTLTGTEIPNESVTCDPTPSDQLGPFYEPNAPVRSSIDVGHLLQGTVLSTVNCTPISGAQIEFWQVGPDGQYDDAHRATTFADTNGAYTFESNYPPPYSGRPPHIHIRVSADGYETLVTQYYPEAGQTAGTFDLVLEPAG